MDMPSDIFSAISLKDALLLFMLILTRWLAMSITPFLGAELLPALVRLALAFNLSLVSFFLLLKQPFLSPPSLLIPFLFIKEAFLGFLFGFLSSLIFHAYQLLGEIIDLARGASNSRLFVPELKSQSFALGVFFFQFSLVIFLAYGLHREFLSQILQSFYRFHPFDLTLMPVANFLTAALSVMSILWQLASRLALPAIVVCLLIDGAFGLLNRVTPQINAFFLSMPAKMVGGLAILFFTLPLIFEDFLLNFETFLNLFKAVFATTP